MVKRNPTQKKVNSQTKNHPKPQTTVSTTKQQIRTRKAQNLGTSSRNWLRIWKITLLCKIKTSSRLSNYLKLKVKMTCTTIRIFWIQWQLCSTRITEWTMWVFCFRFGGKLSWCRKSRRGNRRKEGRKASRKRGRAQAKKLSQLKLTQNLLMKRLLGTMREVMKMNFLLKLSKTRISKKTW